MSTRVLRERINNKVVNKPRGQLVQTTGKENAITSNSKEIGFGAVSFYGSHNDSEISNIRKERLRRSIKLSQQLKTQKKSENNSLKNKKQRNIKFSYKKNINQKQNSKETDEEISRKRCKYEFESSSVGINNEQTFSPKKISQNQENNCIDTGKRFFLSRRSSSSLEGKMIMAVNKGRFHLQFKRGTVKKNKKSNVKPKNVQKQKKAPLTVNIKSISEKGKNNHVVNKHNKNNIIPNPNKSADMKNINSLSNDDENAEKLVEIANINSFPDDDENIDKLIGKKNINSLPEDDENVEKFQIDEILDDHISENEVIPFDTLKNKYNSCIKTSTPIKPSVFKKLQLDEFSNLPKICEDPSVISNATSVAVENSKLNLQCKNLYKVQKKLKENDMNVSDSEISEKKNKNSHQTINEWKKILPETSINENSFTETSKQKRNNISPKTNSKFYSKDKNTSQLIIDAGQKELGAKHCPSCNMLYTSGDQEDERTHKKYHNSYLAKLNFPGWKKERVLGEFSDGRIIMILPSDPKYTLKKMKTLEQIIDRDLGVTSGVQTKMNMTYVLFISTESKIAGCAIAEKISQAHRVIPSATSSRTGSPKKILHSESESVKALCGICRLWTAPMYRRQKVASRILDCLRCNFIYGYLLDVDDIAFLDPTIDGRQFVEKYTNTSNYLVYFKT